jgi:hypothetical protein
MTTDEIQRRAAAVRQEWSPEERLARLELPPDSALWDEFGLRKPDRRNSDSRSNNSRDGGRSRPQSRVARPQRGF